MGTRAVLDANQPLVLFDSTCLLCNKSVQLLLKLDRKKTFKFASLSSNINLPITQSAISEVDSIILFHKNKISIKSTAILKIGIILGFPYSLSIIFFLIPKVARDWIYDTIANHRIKWFGRQDQCVITVSNYPDRIIN